jgi:hypothetical protein
VEVALKESGVKRDEDSLERNEWIGGRETAVSTLRCYKSNPVWDRSGEYMMEFTGECAGCDRWQTLDDLGLCAECAMKMERDLIRQRAWDYSATAFACDPGEIAGRSF